MPEPELEWQQPKSLEEGQEEWLEVAFGPDGLVHIRQNTRPDEIVTTTTAKWDAWVLGVKAGEFDHFVE
ncbi:MULTISPECIES: DUF397 domain-containing protein [Streptomyces]|uniref:DUF397 domain-containing protein n=1 Tax=Streptomyces lycii TaxID=2654337 RepID=A0ABQ7FC51_9ACTN|nr:MULTISPECIES: DUF397 domain-containing protein [Streptomyces]KAF4405914.1 DUF397 domain-containing protein [Streptomyces lycii]PGH52532.1 DUF397 domain-containing protein [Streptomyces sp. Ru87]